MLTRLFLVVRQPGVDLDIELAVKLQVSEAKAKPSVQASLTHTSTS